MKAAAKRMNNKVYIAEPLEHQQPVVDHPARYKVLRCGRRWGKTRIIFYCCIVGHGPQKDGHEEKVRGEVSARWNGPRWRGLAQGWDVAWIVRDYKQATTLWEEEIEPRFRDKAGIDINVQDRQVTFPAVDVTLPDGKVIQKRGTLWIRSAENIDSVRGAGANLIGVVVDEAAWQDLKRHIQTVLRPAMMDNKAWLFLASTTNAGKDGNAEQILPSYFNRICEEINQEKDNRKKWKQWHGTAWDNPKLDPEEIQELVDEYTDGSLELQQEVFAELVTTGAGLAFPEWSTTVHTDRYDPPKNDERWVWTGGGDWGLSSPGVLFLMATGSERSIVRLEYAFNGRFRVKGKDGQLETAIGAREAGYRFGCLIRDQAWPIPEWMAVDTPPMSDKVPNILERLEQGYRKALGKRATTAWINPPKGPGSRKTKKTLLHDSLRYRRTEDGKVPDWGMPQLQVHPSCAYLVSSLPKLVTSEKDPEDVNTGGDDHAYDGLTAWIMAREPEVEAEKEQKRTPNRAPDWVSVVSHGKKAPAPASRRAARQETGQPARRWQRVRP